MVISPPANQSFEFKYILIALHCKQKTFSKQGLYEYRTLSTIFIIVYNETSSYFLAVPITFILIIENGIYWEKFSRKKCKTAILLHCFHTAGVLHIFMLYNLLGLGISFYRKSKIIVKRKPNYEIGWFHNWPIIISHRLYAFHFTNDFPL